MAGRKKLIYFKSSFCEKTLTIFIISSMVDLVFGSKHSSTMAAISFIECFPSQHVQTEAAVMFKLCASSFRYHKVCSRHQVPQFQRISLLQVQSPHLSPF